MGILNRNDVAILLGVTPRSIENNPHLMVISRKEGSNRVWDEDDINQYISSLKKDGLLDKNKVMLKVGLSDNQLRRDASLMSLSTLVSGRNMWKEEDVDKYLLEKRVKKAEELSVDDTLSIRDSIGDFKSILMKYVRNCKEGGIIYCKDLDTNEWGTASENFFLDLKTDYLKDIQQQYLNLLILRKSSFLLTKEDIRTRKVPPIYIKWKKIIEYIQSDPDFMVMDLPTFSNDREEMKYKFFDLDGLKPGRRKHWDIWESQIREEDREVYKAFIYSIYVAKNRSRQVLWLNDTGESGKTKTMNALGSAGGDNFTSSPKFQQLNDKHFGTYFDKKRLVLFDDMENPFFLSNSIIKTVTGSGQLTVDKKGAPNPYVTKTNLKVVVGSNYKPILSGQRAEASRLILVEVQSPTDENFKYMTSIESELDDILIKEFPAYLYKCRKSYNKLCVNDGKIMLSEDQIQRVNNCQSIDVSLTSQFINSFFIYDKDSSLNKDVMDAALDHYRMTTNNEIKYDKVLSLLNVNNVVTKTYVHKGVEMQKYVGIGLSDMWIFKSNRIQQKTSVIDEMDWD